MSRLSFTPRWHQYALDRKRVPGVTSVTSKALAKDGMPWAAAKEAALWAVLNRDAYDVLGEAEWVKAATRAHRDKWDRSRDDGSMLHTLAESLAYGTLMPDEVDGEPVPDNVADMAEQLSRFYDAWNVQPVVHEGLIFNERAPYAGRFDLVADLSDGKRWLLDYKTTESGVWPETSLQLTAYRFATHYVDANNVDQPMESLGIEDTAVVWLRPGGWELVPVRSDPVVFGVFAHCYEVARWANWKREESVYDALPRPERVAP